MFGDFTVFDFIKLTDWTFRYLGQNSYSDKRHQKLQKINLKRQYS